MEAIGAILYIAFFVFVIGLCIGSFLNVVILRAFSNESIAFPASKCPLCQAPLKWWHNIPVLSYLILRGKCAFCSEKISIQYPIVELTTGLLFVAVAFKFGFSINTIFMLIFTSLFLVLAITDIKEKVIFDYHAYILVGFGLIYSIYNGIWLDSILGIVLGVVVMEVFARLGYLVAGQRAFGEGDSYIAAGLGAVFGWKLLITILIYSVIVQLIYTIPMFLKKLYNQKDFVTLGSFIGFFLYVILFKLAGHYGLANNMILFLIMVIILATLGLFVCKRIISGLKNPDGMTYLPFGPAMVVAAFIIMFAQLPA